MKNRFAARLALIALAAAPLHAAPVWVPVVGPQGADGQSLATQLRVAGSDGVTKSYSAAGETGLLELEGSQVDAWIQTARGGRTFITRVPVISADNRLEAGATTFLNGLNGLNGLDRNLAKLGLVNLGAEAARCDVDFLGADGSLAAASASVVVPARSLRQLGDALPVESAVAAARISCGQPFYAYAVGVDRATSEVSFATPESALAVKTARQVVPKGTLVFNAPGLLHKASPQNEKGTLNIPVPSALALSQMTIDWDVTLGPWSTKNPAGCHALLWLHRGRFRSDTIANANYYGPKKNFVKNNQNLDLPKTWNTNASGNIRLQTGQTYHFHYVYDAATEKIVITTSQNGRVLKTMRMDGSADNNTITVPAAGLVAEFGHYSFQSGPEVATWGWSYSNLRVEMVQR
ncbi:MAG TPA: hypothetical protein VIA62_27270 [Thermoanaerobaculia bacterium]|jgi:hypothetical protein|nr:hypothetical protein [Thermoanaerobaculia bacterium]